MLNLVSAGVKCWPHKPKVFLWTLAPALTRLERLLRSLRDIVLNGDSSIVADGAQLYGLRNHPKARDSLYRLNLASTTGANWVTEIVACVKAFTAKTSMHPNHLPQLW